MGSAECVVPPLRVTEGVPTTSSDSELADVSDDEMSLDGTALSDDNKNDRIVEFWIATPMVAHEYMQPQ